MHYRLQIVWTYTNVSNANGSVSDINTVLANAGYAETASRSGTEVTVVVDNIPDQAAAETLRDSLLPAWSARARSFGKTSVVRSD